MSRAMMLCTRPSRSVEASVFVGDDVRPVLSFLPAFRVPRVGSTRLMRRCQAGSLQILRVGRLCRFVLFALMALTAFPCWSQGFSPLSAEDLKMTSEPKAPGAPAIILFREVDRDDSGEGRVHENRYYRVKILTEEGRKYGNIEIPFIKGVDEVTHIRARTVESDGSAVDFDDRIFEKAVLKARSVRIVEKTFTLPAVEPGCVIEYSYTLDFHRAYASHWILNEDLFTRTARFSLKPYKGNFAPVMLLQSWKNLPPGARPLSDSNSMVTMEAHDILPFQTEDFMPPANELKSRVDFSYETGKRENSPEEFWKQVGRTRNTQLENFVGKQKAIDEALRTIIAPNDAPEVKLRKIYERVQKIRNTSFELHKTEQEEKREKEKIDLNVADVWKRGYGNTWQLDWLFLALARAAGFESYGCWVSSRAEYFFTPVTMQSGHLNEPAVLIKLNGEDLFLNPGMAFAPFGMLNWSETGAAAMRLDKDGGTWVKTSLPKSSESRIEHVAKLHLTDAGDLEGKLTVTYTGLEAMYHRQDVRNADDVSRKKFLEDRMKHQIPISAEVELTNNPDWTSAEKPLVAEFNMSVRGWASNAGKRTLIPAGLFTAGEKHIFEHEDRTHPIYIEYPYEKVDDVTMELPQGWQVSTLPPLQKKDTPVISYSSQVDKDGATLHMTRMLGWHFLLLDKKYYPALRDFLEAVRASDEQQIVLQPEAAAASR